MINPTPVSGKRTPYDSKSRSSLPKSMAVPPKKGSSGFNWKKLFIYSFVLLVLSTATYAYAQFNSLTGSIIVQHNGENSSILGYSDLNSIDAANFKKAGDGRFNIVIVGVGGSNHLGGNLTDSIQVMSIDTINKKVGITSVPRDLYVKISGSSYTKINEAYERGETQGTGKGGLVLRQTVGNVLGINISNFVMVDFAGAKDLIDTLGGIDVNVPKSIYDPYFPDGETLGYAPFSIKAGEQHLDGNAALRYSRSRYTTTDYDRSARQQLVIAAMKDKALSLGTLSNPTKISGIVSALGSHIKTDLQMKELFKFIALYKDIPSDSTTTNVLSTDVQLGLLQASDGTSAGSISYPMAGQGNFSDIHDWFQKNNPDPLIAKEGATITVVPGDRATTKEVKSLVSTLNDYGYKATVGTQVYNRQTSETQIFDTTKGKKPVTSNYLNSFFDTSISKGSPLDSGSDFEIVYK